MSADTTAIDALRVAAQVIREGTFLTEALAAAPTASGSADYSALLAALSTVGDATAALVDEIALLVEDPDADPLGSADRIIEAVIELVEGITALVDALDGPLALTLPVEGVFDLIILVAARVLDEIAFGAAGWLWALGLLEYRQQYAGDLPTPVIVRRPRARVLVELFEDPQAYLVNRILDRESPAAGSSLIAALAYISGGRLIEPDDDSEWLSAIGAIRSGATDGDPPRAIESAVLVGTEVGINGFAGAAVYATRSDEGMRVRLGLAPVFKNLFGTRIAFSDEWGLEVTADIPLPSFVLELEADPATQSITASAEASLEPAGGGVSLELQGYPTEHPLHVSLGSMGTLDAHGISIGVDLDVDSSGAAFGVGLGIEELKIQIRLGDEVTAVAGEDAASALTFGFEGNIHWHSRDGLTGSLRAGIQFGGPVSWTLGPLSVTRFMIEVMLGIPEGGNFELQGAAAMDLKLELGPLVATAEGLGFELAVAPAETENAVRARIVPPRGLGLAVNATPLEGGGFIGLDPDAGRYSGVFELRVYALRVVAIGLLETKLPQPGPEFALIILVAAEFPGIQLGFGLSLNGISGLLGLHHEIDPDAMRQRLASGAVGDILSPADPVANAPTVIANLEAMFPTKPDAHVIGLGVKLKYIEFISFDIGVLIQLPGPDRIVLIGSARAELGSGDTNVLAIRLDVLGILDFVRQELSIDAALVDSSLLEILQITGGAAIRVSWGPQPYALISVGGFHPDFVPEPEIVPIPDRVGMSAGSPEDFYYLRLQAYFAVTPNTVQFGAALEARLELGPLLVEGALGFDALIQFDPFYFTFEIYARFRVAVGGFTLAGVSLAGSLSGPGPVVLAGEITIQILFFEISFSGSIEMGSQVEQPVPEIESVLQEILPELAAKNVRGLPRGKQHAVVDVSAGTEESPLVDPAASIRWEQRRAPLEMILEMIDGAMLPSPQEVHVVDASTDQMVEEWFAPASYTTYDDAEAINLPAFERMFGGLDFNVGTEPASEAVVHALTVTQFVLPEPVGRLLLTPSIPGWLAFDRNLAPSVARITLVAQPWAVMNRDGTGAEPATTRSGAHQKARLTGRVAVAEGDVVEMGDF
jgi:hypothetical protein